MPQARQNGRAGDGRTRESRVDGWLQGTMRTATACPVLSDRLFPAPTTHEASIGRLKSHHDWRGSKSTLPPVSPHSLASLVPNRRQALLDVVDQPIDRRRPSTPAALVHSALLFPPAFKNGEGGFFSPPLWGEGAVRPRPDRGSPAPPPRRPLKCRRPLGRTL
ncbi:hypothetical protein CDD83_4094 [Cordyceps sp. RAO-2017]|nr:hypothetical protein CDD83_4094 [Cordyceps sp. RAO-2017]